MTGNREGWTLVLRCLVWHQHDMHWGSSPVRRMWLSYPCGVALATARATITAWECYIYDEVLMHVRMWDVHQPWCGVVLALAKTCATAVDECTCRWSQPRYLLVCSIIINNSLVTNQPPTWWRYGGKSLQGILPLGEDSPDSGDVLQRLVSVTNAIMFYFATPTFPLRYAVIAL
jgi:hypothetical protein